MPDLRESLQQILGGPTTVPVPNLDELPQVRAEIPVWGGPGKLSGFVRQILADSKTLPESLPAAWREQIAVSNGLKKMGLNPLTDQKKIAEGLSSFEARVSLQRLSKNPELKRIVDLLTGAK